MKSTTILYTAIIAFMIFCIPLGTIMANPDSIKIETIYKSARDYTGQYNYQFAISKCKEAIDFYSNNSKNIDPLLIEIKSFMLYNAAILSPTDTVLKDLNDLKAESIKWLGENHMRTLKVDQLYGHYYYEKGDYEQAGLYYDEFIRNLEKLEDPPIITIARIKRLAARCYSRNYKNIDKALKIELEVLDILKSYYKEDNNTIAKTLINVGYSLSQKGQIEESLEYYFEAYEMKKRLFGELSPQILQSLINIILSYGNINNFDKALVYCDEAIKIGQHNYKEGHDQLVRLYTMKAELYLKLDDLESANSFLSKAKHMNEKLEYPQKISTIELLNGLGKVEFKSKNFQTTELHFQDAIKENRNDTGNLGLESILNYWLYYLSSSNLSNLYTSWYKSTKNESKLDSAIYYNELSLTFLNDIRENNLGTYEHSYSDAFQHLSWSAAENYYLKSNYKRALAVLEKHKTFTYNQSYYLEQKEGFDIDENLLTKEKETRKLISKIEKELLSIKKDNLQLYIKTLDSINHLKEEHRFIKTSIKDLFPKYYEVMNQPYQLDIDSIQAQLLTDEAIIEYSVSDSLVGIYLITKKDIHIEYLQSKNIQKDVENTYEQLLENTNTKQVMYDLYSRLFEPVEKYISEDIQRLTIIPEWYLVPLSFEALYDGNQFLLNKYSISYNNSASQSYISKKQQTNGNGQVSLFTSKYKLDKTENYEDDSVPIFAELVRSGYYNLPGANAESEAIHSLIDGTHFKHEEANKSNFFREASKYSIIHLAMHSEMDADKPLYSSLLFSSTDTSDFEKLEAYELYNQKFNTDLAVLSACSSGYDLYNRGEGLLGFAKAFAYAGVPSIVYSLWKVPDNATSHIMVNFYTNLKAGQRKDDALKNAKLTYLSDESIPTNQKTPYYWAGFVASGNMSPIKLEDGTPYMVYAILGIGLLGLLIFTKLRAKNAF